MSAHAQRAERAAEWVYRSVWRIIAGWFRVPQQPPDLPVDAGQPVRKFHPSRGFLRYLKFYFWFALVAVDLALLFLWAVVFEASPTASVVLAPIFLFLIVAPDVVAYIAIHLRYDTTWYVMSDRSLRCRRGVWLICEHTITFENVQDVVVKRGPIHRLFGIWRVVIETAGAAEGDSANPFAVGNKAIMEGIDNPDEIREHIMERVRRSRTAGLGDEPRDAAPALEGWSAERLAVLREIRDEARALA